MNVSLFKASVSQFAPATLPFMLSAAAHAANPSIDLGGVTEVMKATQTLALLIGAILALISLVFAVFSFVGGKFCAALPASSVSSSAPASSAGGQHGSLPSPDKGQLIPLPL